jgi:hypothetical protein
LLRARLTYHKPGVYELYDGNPFKFLSKAVDFNSKGDLIDSNKKIILSLSELKTEHKAIIDLKKLDIFQSFTIEALKIAQKIEKSRDKTNTFKIGGHSIIIDPDSIQLDDGNHWNAQNIYTLFVHKYGGISHYSDKDDVAVDEDELMPVHFMDEMLKNWDNVMQFLYIQEKEKIARISSVDNLHKRIVAENRSYQLLKDVKASV